jgi:hypothetical protein
VSDKKNPRLAAIDYLNDVADVLHVSKEQLKDMQQPVSHLDLMEQGIGYRLSEEKQLFD